MARRQDAPLLLRQERELGRRGRVGRVERLGLGTDDSGVLNEIRAMRAAGKSYRAIAGGNNGIISGSMMSCGDE